MGLQYVSVKFNPWDRREYTYHWEGDPLAVGAEVLVETKTGVQTVTVAGVRANDDPPEFATKPILGLAGEGA